MSQADSGFARSELERIFTSDDELTSLCRKNVKSFWPNERSAGILVRDKIIASLRDKKPLSLLRVGNGEGNAVSMTKNTLHSLQISTFYTEFVSQNGISIRQDAAIKFCAEVRTALVTADIVGFRSFRFDERSMIRESIDQGDAYAALGFLYARELLQDGLSEGYWRRSIVTSAWIHLELIPHLSDILETAGSVIIVTGRGELHDKMRLRAGARLEAFITVPVQGFQPPSLEQSHFVEAFPLVRERLSQDMRGKLVLVGAGLFGKVYCHTAQQHGAVAIDFGSAFDILAGLNTRPIHRLYDINALRWM